MRTAAAMMFSVTDGVVREHFGAILLEGFKQRAIADNAALDDFVESGAVLALRQGAQHIRVDQDRERLMKRAEQVLAGNQIDAGLAADRGVDLREQRGRDLQHRDAAHEDGGQKAADIRHDAAAESDYDAGAVAAAFNHLLGQRFDFREPLAFFAAGQEQGLESAAAEAGSQPRPVQIPNVFCRDDKQRARRARNELGRAAGGPAFNDRIVSALRRSNAKGWHKFVVPWILPAARMTATALLLTQ